MEKPTFFATQEAFREWLAENHNKMEELWVGYYKKATGKPSITWPESVDQALCFGWIDGIRKKVDEESYKIRFTPRKPKSFWSAVNIKKMEELTKKGLVMPAGLKAFDKMSVEKSKKYSYEQKNVEMPETFLEKIRENEAAWQFFENLAPSYKRATIWWVVSAKREETRLRRLDVLIESSTAGQKIPQLRRPKK